jgi:hypothetical protein
MMTVFGMVFERHGREFPVVNGASLPGRALRGNPADPCNNVSRAVVILPVYPTSSAPTKPAPG